MRKLLFFVFAAFALAACEQAPIEEQSAIRPDVPDTITVGFEGDETRIQLNASQKTVWTKGDQVSVFYKSYDNLKFEFEGNTGDRNGTLKRVGGQHNGQTMDDVVVVYPYSADYMITLSEGCVNATIPSTQTYLKGSYGVGDNLMIARSSFNQFTLKSVCGWLKIQLTGAGEVIERITFRGNDGEQVAGLVYVDATTAEATLATAMNNSDDNSQLDGTLVLDDSIYTEVILDCGEGVALGKNSTAFYIALPPQTFEKGFTVEIEDTEGYVMEQSTDKALLIERNHIQPMAALEFINPNRPTQPTPANNEIWYTATEKADPYFDDFLTFGSDLVSNVWDSETKMGIITFDGDVTMIGDEAFNNCDKLTSVTLPESVTSIGKKAFNDCDGLTEFTIPDSVTEIGSSAFYYCGKLASVTIGDSVTTIGEWAFASCDSLTSVTIPDSVTTIETGAFSNCDSLTSVTIGDSVTTIAERAFSDCESLTSVTIPDSVTSIGDKAFRYCESLTSVTIPDSVTTIGEYAFADCYSLTSVTIPDSVTTTGEYAFSDCSSLTSITIPDSVTTIAEGAFYGCSSLTSVTIPDSVTSIGNSAFAYCTSLTSATIPDSVTTIGYWTFTDCYSLTSVTIPDSVTTIEYCAFSNCDSLTSVTIPDSVTTIGNSAFSNCSSLTSVTIPDSVTSIGFAAFAYCGSLAEFKGKFAEDNGRILVVDGTLMSFALAGLTEYTIPNSVTTIGGDAFRGCSSLTSVTIPNSVTSIGYRAFERCTSLTSVYCYATIPPSLGSDAFSNNASVRRFYVYEECVELYKSAWSSYKDSIYTNGQNCPNTITIEYTTSDGNTINSSALPIISNSYENGVGTMVIAGENIPNKAFYRCSSLTSVTIPDSVTTIGNQAFQFCSSLTSVYCKATTPPALDGTSVFDNNRSGRKIYVPAESVEAYKSATNWSEYKSAIVGYDF